MGRPSAIEDTLKLFFKDGDTILIAVLLQSGRMAHRFFATVSDAAAYAEEQDQQPDMVSGIYFPIQRLKADARSNSKKDVHSYIRFFVDVDRKIKKDANGDYQNATEEERLEIAQAVEKIVPWVSEILGAKPTICDSGNGLHLTWELSIPCRPSDENFKTLRECLFAIKQKFESGNVEIDVSVADQGQLVRLWGTWNRKAPAQPSRPQRRSKLLARGSGKVLPSALDVLSTYYDVPKPAAKKAIDRGGERTRKEWREEYGVAHLLDWSGQYAPLLDTYEKNGSTHYMIDNCMFETADGLHKHSGTDRKTELIEYPDGGVGLSCLGSEDWFRENFPGEPKPAFRHFIKRLNQLKGESYPVLIFPENDVAGDLAAFGVDVEAEEMEAKVALPVYEPGEAAPCYKPGCHCGLYHPLLVEAPALGSVQELEAKHELAEPADVRGAEVPLAVFPETCMYGYLGELARKLECPLGYAYPAILAVYASRWTNLGTRTVRSNLFVMLLGDTSAGKTRTQTRALATCIGEGVPRVYSEGIGSGEGLLVSLGAKLDKDIEDIDRLVPLPCLLHQDETRELFGKMAIDGSSLPYKLNQLFDQDHIGGSVKKGRVTAFARVSFLGGLTVENTAEFSEIFGKATVTGLYVRFLYGYHRGMWEFDDRWEEFQKVAPESWAPAAVRFTEEIFRMKSEWERANQRERGQRLSQLALRVAAITAAANGDEAVTPDCMQAALRFMEWQQEVRRIFKPSRADSMGGRYSEMIMEEAWKHTDAMGNFLPFGWRKAYRDNRWYAKDGSQITRQRDILVKLGMLIQEKDESKPNRLLYRAAKWSKDDSERGDHFARQNAND